MLRYILPMILPLALGAYADLKQAQWHFGEYQKAQASSEKALADKNQAEYQNQLAKVREHLAGARREYEESGAGDAPGTEAFTHYVEVLRAGGDFDLGVALMESALKKDADNPGYLYALGDFAFHAGAKFYKQSFAALKKAVEVNPNCGECQLRLGQIYRAQIIYGEARICFEKALELESGLAEAKIELAVLDLREGNMVGASSVFDALGKDAQPFDVQTRLLLRDALAETENLGGMFTDTPEFHLAYSRLLYRAARITDAMLAAYRVVKLKPEDGETWSFIGSMQQQSGNLAGAVQAYEEALKFLTEKAELEKVIAELKAAQAAGQKK